MRLKASDRKVDNLDRVLETYFIPGRVYFDLKPGDSNPLDSTEWEILTQPGSEEDRSTLIRKPCWWGN
jgi:hypothetical protein